jgi:leader peptidase (prepilin peptidase)/N-methyltransferase
MTDPLRAVLLALFGLAVGSFLNVCIYRLPRREGLASPGSHCTSCGRQLAWFENIPLASWVALGGRCRTCRTRVSIRYPLVEIVTSLLFVGAYEVYGWAPILLARIPFACAMVVLFAIDLEHQVLPDAITLPGAVAGVLFSLVLPPGWMASLLGLLGGGGVLFLIAEAYYRLRGVEGLGGGDVKMLAMIGAFLGWKLMLVTLVLASFAGSVVGLGLIVSGRGSMKAALPFGTFLAAAAVAAAVGGDRLVAWYSSLYA